MSRLGMNTYPHHLPLILLGHRARSRQLESAVIMRVVATETLTTKFFALRLNLLKVTFNWPTSLTVENVSDKAISGLTLEVFAG
jgi:hypothetical protein